MKKINAMSLLSLLLILTMIVVIMAASVPMISQNVTKISKGKKKFGEVSLNEKNGYFICYYDVDEAGEPILAYKQVEIDLNGSVSVISDVKNNNECKFIIPSADSFEITLIGGGGGGASSFVENIPQFDVVQHGNKSENVIIDEVTISYKMFNSYKEYITEDATISALNRLMGDTKSFFIEGKNGVCMSRKEKKFNDEEDEGDEWQLSPGGGDIVLKFLHQGSEGSETMEIIKKYGNKSETVAHYEDSHCSSGAVTGCACVDAMPSNEDSLDGDKFRIKFKSSLGKIVTIKQGEPFNLKLYSFVLGEKMGEPGEPGQIVKFKTAYLAPSSESELIIPKGNIGQGGLGGSNDMDDGAGYKGGETKISLINGTVIKTADGGEGGKRKNETYITPIKIKEKVDGIKGIKGDFYIPSWLEINTSKLLTGFGSTCSSENCSEIKPSRYPGSSGASSGYNIGTDEIIYKYTGEGGKINKIQLNSPSSVSSIQAKDDSGDLVCLYPENCDTTQDILNNLKPVMGNGGQGAHGAILISW